MKSPSHILSACVVFVAMMHSTSAAILLSDDFESYTAGNQLGTNATWATVANNTANSTKFIRDEGTATPFGSPNQYLELRDTGSNTTPAEYLRIQTTTQTAASAELTTIQFDFFEPTGGSNNLGFGLAMTNNDLNTGGSRIRLTLNNGTIGGTGFTASSNSYSLNTAYTMYVVFNDTASAVSYDGGTVAAFTADVWFQSLSGGGLVFAGSADAQNNQTASYSFVFRTFNADQQSMNVDNFSWYEGAAAIPEPSSALMGGLGLFFLLRRRRGN